MEVYKVLFLLLLQSSVHYLECEGRPFVMLIPIIASALAPALSALATYSATTAGAGAVVSGASALMGSLTGANMRNVMTATQTAVTPALANTAAQISNMARDRLAEHMKPENLQEYFKTGSQYMADNPDAIEKHIGLVGQIRNHLDYMKSEPALEIRFTDDTSEDFRKAFNAMMDWRTSKMQHKYLSNAPSVNPHDKEYPPIEVVVKSYPVKPSHVRKASKTPTVGGVHYDDLSAIQVVVTRHSVVQKKHRNRHEK